MAIKILKLHFYPTIIFKSKYIHFVLAILFVLNSISKSNAQTVFCPPNINFENGNLNNWLFYTGKCCPIVADTLSGAISNRHTLTSGSGVDPYGGFPVVAPGGGNFSFKLGNDDNGGKAERAIYYINVPSGANNYKIIFKYAVVFEDAGHSSSEQPRFTVKAIDTSTNSILQCVNFNFVAIGSSLPGFQKSSINKNSDADIYYKSWSSANLDLSGCAGKTIAIEFASGDCSLGGHFGYGYIDIDCDVFKISTISCKGNPVSILAGPIDFYEYKWYDSTFSTLLGTNRILNIATPTTFNKFKLITKPYPTFGCADTLTTVIRISDLKLNLQNDTLVCGGSPFPLQNTVTVSSFFQPINYNWIPSSGLSCSNCLNPIVSPPSTTKYLLTTTDVNGCVQKDSFIVTLKLNITSQPKNISVCLDSLAKFKVKVNSTLTFSYQWKKNGVNIIGANTDSLIIPNTSYGDTANYSVLVIANCDSVLSNIATLKIIKPVFFTQPVSLIQCLGTRAVFKATLTSDTNMVYQWYKRGILLPGANKDSLVINNISNLDTGFYYLKVTGKCNYTISDTVKLTIANTTIINSQPQSISQCKNSTAVFKVKAIGPGILNYQWKKGNTDLIGQTKDSLVLNNLNYSDSGDYSVKIWSLCDTVISTFAKLIIFKSTTILTQPINVSACKDSTVKFKVNAVGYGNVIYKWKKNGQDIIGANADSLVIPIVNYSDTGDYSVLVSSFCDSVLSNNAKLKVFFPIFTKQPISILQCSGTKAIFKSRVTNDTNIIYKWYRNGNLVSGANKDSLLINNITNSDTGFYQIKATGKCISVFSDTVYLRLYKNTTINAQPQSVSQCINTTAFLTVKATGSGVISYQWKKGNTILSGQTTDSLIINNINYADTGIYSVNVKSNCDSLASANARISIVPNTKIILQPQSVLQCLNSKVVLKVKGTGTGLLTYQWLKNNNIIPGSTADSLYFNAVNASDSANYSVIVRSQCDSVISQIAKISLFPNNKVNLPKTTYLCTEIGKIGISKFKSYLWNTGVKTDSILVPTNGSYWIKYEDFNGCFNTDTTQIILNSRPLIKAGKDTVMCNDLELKVKGAAINYDSVFWVQNDFGTFGNYKLLQTTFKAKPTTEGNKWLVLSSKNKCGVLLDSFKVYFTPIPNAFFYPSDTLVCQFSKPVTITPIDSIGVFVGEHIFNKLFTPNVVGIFKIKYIISRNFCSSNSEKTIEVVPQPIAEFYTMPINPNIDKPVQFVSNSKFANNYLWTFENTTFSNIQNPIYHFLDEGFYRIQLKAINRICSDTTSKLLHIKGSNNIFIPNAFTPNQNGLNEEFKVLYKNSKGAVLSIYNRWGQLIFTSNNVNKGWDGTFDGNPCQEDVYYYIVDYTNNDDEVKQLKGNITLIR